MTNPPQKHLTRKRRLTPLAVLTASLIGSILCGCANTSHMALYQNTVLGVNGAVNPENSNVHVKVGFSREFITIIPKVANPDPTNPEVEKEAGSVFATSRTNVSGLNIPEVDEVIITGTAAHKFAATQAGHEVFNPSK